jgi:predicted peroxiredoxin
VTRMLFHCTHGRDDPKRAIVPFIAANVAAAFHTDPAPAPAG